MMAKNDDSVDQSSLDHDEKRPHDGKVTTSKLIQKRSEDKGTFSPETNEPGSVSHPRIVPKHMIY